MKDKRFRPKITREEYSIIQEFRLRHEALEEECKSQGLPVEDVKHYWMKTERFSMFVRPNQFNYEDIRDEMILQMNKYSPVYPEIKRVASKDGHMLVVDPADIHFGKLARAYETGDEYNMKIAEQRVMQGVQGILNKTAGFKIDQIMLVIGNDILHIDNPKRQTTSGTPQDTDGMWYDAYLKAKDTIIKVVEMLLPIADLHIVYNPSNHDYMSGFYLADSIYSWFRQSKNITFDFSIAHRKYFKYHNSLIGTTHGDGAKENDLPILMAQESGSWGSTKHRYFYTHHVHHKTSKDIIGVTVESLRSPSSTDSWHHRNGYQHSPKAIEAFIHSHDHGQIARITHIF